MTNQKTQHNLKEQSIDRRSTGHNSTYTQGGVPCSADTFVGKVSSVLRINFSGNLPALHVAAKRCA
jgi:hypothetical protein